MSKRLARTLTIFLLILSASAAAFAAPSRLAYEITPAPAGDTPKIEIVLSFTGDESGSTEIRLPSEFGGQTELFRGVRNLRPLSPGATLHDGEIAELKTIRHAPSATIRLAYEIVQDWSGVPQGGGASGKAGGGYRPILQPGYFHFIGAGAFVYPAAEDDEEMRISLEWKNVPPGWTLANSFGAEKTRQEFSADVAALVAWVFVGGDFELRRRAVNGRPVLTAQRGEWKFSGDEFADLVARVVLVQRDFWRDHEQPFFLVTLIPLADNPQSLSIGGTGLTNSFATFATPNAGLETLQFIISHEYFHHWNYPKLGGLADPEQKLYWFSEGVTDYYTYVLLARGGFFDLEKLSAKYNEFLADYYLSPVRNEPNERVARDFFKDYAVVQLPYRRGFLLATKWDRLIRAATNGRRSLDDVMRDIFADAQKKKYGKLTKARIAAYLAGYARHDFAADIEKYIERGETIGDFAGALGPCVESYDAELGRFELGFDLDAASREKRIAGVAANSAAYAAGLRDGQKVLARSIYFGRTDREVAIEVEDGGARKKINYLPVAKDKTVVPQFRVKSGLTAEAAKKCLAAL